MRICGERGQAIILMVGVLTVIFAVAAIVVDVGLWFAERSSVQRAADFAALAGSQELPVDDAQAVASAIEWAERNGYEDGVDGAEVTVELLCKNTLPDPPEGICVNSNPTGGPSTCAEGQGCDGIRVTISKPAGRLFTSIFGVGDVVVASGAAAGLDVYAQPVDAMLLIDATGSMSRPPLCNEEQTNDSCPIKEARDAAHSFVDVLLDSGGPRQVGYAPYRGCYRPPVSFPGCAPAIDIMSLTEDAGALHDAVGRALGPLPGQPGSGTNMCLALLKAQELLDDETTSQGEGTRRVVVLLADGDSTYNADAISDGQPPAQCAPNHVAPDPATELEYLLDQCMDAAHPSEAELDALTLAMAEELKAEGVDIYVVGLGVCGGEDGNAASDAGYCAAVGSLSSDAVANQRLLKCIASSPSQYHRVTSAQELGDIFQLIAWEIVGRGLIQ